MNVAQANNKESALKAAKYHHERKVREVRSTPVEQHPWTTLAMWGAAWYAGDFIAVLMGCTGGSLAAEEWMEECYYGYCDFAVRFEEKNQDQHLVQYSLPSFAKDMMDSSPYPSVRDLRPAMQERLEKYVVSKSNAPRVRLLVVNEEKTHVALKCPYLGSSFEAIGGRVKPRGETVEAAALRHLKATGADIADSMGDFTELGRTMEGEGAQQTHYLLLRLNASGLPSLPDRPSAARISQGVFWFPLAELPEAPMEGGWRPSPSALTPHDVRSAMKSVRQFPHIFKKARQPRGLQSPCAPVQARFSRAYFGCSMGQTNPDADQPRECVC